MRLFVEKGLIDSSEVEAAQPKLVISTLELRRPPHEAWSCWELPLPKLKLGDRRASESVGRAPPTQYKMGASVQMILESVTP
jgi:hypothetical protein